MRVTFGKVLLITSVGLTLLAGGFVIWTWKELRREFPRVDVLSKQYPVVKYLGPKRPFTVTLVRERPGHWASLGEISQKAQWAIVVSEDWAFFSHEGYDPSAIKEALHNDWERGKISHGASTITQQVVKNVFLSQEKTLTRKLKELVLAVELDRDVTKKRILEVYLNLAEWGEGIFGIRAAAQAYFQKSPSELTAKEGAFLAMLLPSPKRYSQSFRNHKLTPYAHKIIDSILHKLVKAKILTEEERVAESAQPLSFERANGEGVSDQPEPEETPDMDDPSDVSTTPPGDSE